VIDAAPEPQIVNLSDLDTSEPAAPEFRLSELIPCGEVTLLAAHGGTGKTALAQHMAVCLAMGLPCMGKTSKPSKVLFYSAEDGATVMRWKFAKECRRMGIASAALAERLTLVDASEADPVLFHEVTQGGARSGKVTAEFNRLDNLMAKMGAEVLIVDNASDVYAADENNRPQVRAFLRSLRKLVTPFNGAVLLLVHVDKATAKAGGSEGYSGSTAWHNSVRSRLFLTTITTLPDGLMLEQKKSNRGRCSDPIILKWSEGLPTFQGSYIETQTSDTDVLNSIVSMVHEYHQRGETLSTSATAHTNAFKVLSSDKSFPKIDKSRFWALLRDAERMGLIHREVYQTAHRKTAERWRASFAPSAPS
jgi:RecA-family ATPase